LRTLVAGRRQTLALRRLCALRGERIRELTEERNRLLDRLAAVELGPQVGSPPHQR
jgi:hypothetical protein